ncbi:hypothetical protein ABZ570_09875 [Micromonospora sp. NPDC007271]|uniref:hypothetical protein n=1 Tax=Micromonospora sp. NPDC007271 TaxID=3154587 RepID=UPI00340EBDFA
MLPVTFAPPLWAATLRTLRELARVAVAALVLVVGLNGLAVAPASAGALRPSEAAGPVTEAPAIPAPVDGPLGTAPGAGTVPILLSTSAAAGASAAAVRLTGPDNGPATVGQPRPSGSPWRGGAPEAGEVGVAPPPAGAVLPSADPGRESIARRGPPRG